MNKKKTNSILGNNIFEPVCVEEESHLRRTWKVRNKYICIIDDTK